MAGDVNQLPKGWPKVARMIGFEGLARLLRRWRESRKSGMGGNSRPAGLYRFSRLTWLPCLAALTAAALLAGCADMNGGDTVRTRQEEGAAKDKAGGVTGKGVRAQATTPAKRSGTPDLADGPEAKLREPKPMTLADLRAKYKSTFLLQGPGDKREVALTFDDAPDDVFTPRVLDVLKREGVKATFFVVGNRVEKHPDVMRRIVAEGHVVGNHSWSHANLPKLSDEQFREEIRKTDRIIRQYTGYTPSFVRPPYGNITEEQIKWLASQKRKVVGWNVDSLDWKSLSREEVATNILAHVKPGAIILQHSAGGIGEDLTGTIEALPEVIGKLRADGVEFVTVARLLGIPQ
jgi:peptidoglycan/xylan/chitin deacetylase (PgdA/CDA1 family)